uniref:Uncharacterized protein n=1 Tax=Anguilla anguilla TaxID=7936 RepID=A0A0E9Q6B6_ANGAN
MDDLLSSVRLNMSCSILVFQQSGQGIGFSVFFVSLRSVETNAIVNGTIKNSHRPNIFTAECTQCTADPQLISCKMR